MTMAQGNYLPGTYSRVGTEENPGTYLGGDSGGTSQTMPPKVKKVWVLEHTTDGTCAIIGFLEGSSVFRQYGYLPKEFGTTSANG